MGGNCSYNEEWGVVPDEERTHTDTGYKIDGYKVVFYTKKPGQCKNIINSNTKDTIYLIAKIQDDRTIKIEIVDVFNGHELAYEINLEFDVRGDLLPYNAKPKGSHAHLWAKDPQTGKLGRKSHDKKNNFAIDEKYASLVSKIVEFNKQKNKYEGDL